MRVSLPTRAARAVVVVLIALAAWIADATVALAQKGQLPVNAPSAEDLESIKPPGIILEKAAPDWFDSFTAFIDKKIARAEELDIYGNTGQLPEGIFGIKYTFRYLAANERFLDDGKKTSLIPPISFSDGDGNELVNINLNGKGSGNVHIFNFSVGLTDWINPFLEIQFADVRTTLKPTASFGGALAGLGLEDYEDLVKLINALGRPAPNEVFDTNGLEFEDIQTGVSTNWYHGPEWSLGNTFSMFFPTGGIADPNNDINFALGPELDRGSGAYQLLFVSAADYRPAFFGKRFVFSAECDYKYSFTFNRKTPTTFTAPNPVLKALLDAVGFDSSLFPDLSNVPPTYRWTPGQTVDLLGSVSVDLDWVGIGLQYGYSYGGAVKIESTSEELFQLIEALELTGESSSQGLSITVAPNTLKLGLPFLLGVVYEYPLAGSNSIVFDPSVRVITQFFIPAW